MADLESGAIFAGHRIEGVAGRGGFGTVYRATHIHLDHVVALKLISAGRGAEQSFRDRFISESRIAVSIRHPNVVAVHNAGEEDGLLFVTMDFIDGTDLRGLLNREGRLRPEDAVEIVGQVSAALDAAHEKGLVHRDIKPGNVLIDERGGGRHVYLTDFGLSKQMDATSGVTATGAFVGTLDYVAPEQIKGDRVDARTDVYALGCVMFELLSGDLPFTQEEKVAKIYAHLQEQPPELIDAAPEVPASLSEVVWRAMSKSPDDRQPSAGDFARAARAALEGRQPSEPERNVGTGAAAPTQAYNVLAAAAAGAGIDETVESQPPAGSTAEVAPPEAPAGSTAEVAPPAGETEAVPPPAGATEAVPPPAKEIPPAEADVTPEASTPGETIAVPPPDAPSKTGAPGEPGEPAAPDHTARPKRGGGAKVLVGIVAALALAGGAYAVLGGGGGDEEPSTGGGQQQQQSGGGNGGSGDGETLKPLATVAPEPVAIDVSPDGVLYVSSRGGGGVLTRLSSGSGNELSQDKLGGSGEGLNVDADGFVWVAVSKGGGAAGEVQRFDADGSLQNTFDTETDPRGVGGGEENQWVANSGSNSVTRIDRTTLVPTQLPLPDGQVGPSRVAEGVPQQPTAGIWISNSGSGSVTRITKFGEVMTEVSTGGEPQGIVATEDAVWVADQAGSELVKITPAPSDGLLAGQPAGNADAPIDLAKEGCEQPRNLARGFGSIWITCGATGNLLRVNESSGKAEGSIDVAPDPDAVVAFDGEAVWVTAPGDGEGNVFEINPDDVK